MSKPTAIGRPAAAPTIAEPRLPAAAPGLGERLAGTRLGRWWVERSPAALSIRWRLTIWYAALLALTLATFSLVVYYFVGWSLMQNVDRQSVERADLVEDILRRQILAVSISPGNARALQGLGILDESVDPFREPGVGVRVLNISGQVIDGSRDLLRERERIPLNPMVVVNATRDARGGTYREVLSTPEGEFYTYSRPLRDGLGNPALIIQILTSRGAYHDTMGLIGNALTLMTVLATALALATGAAMAETALAPIDAIARTAERISRARDLSRRIPRRGPPDEIGRLTDTVNGMLDRIEQMFVFQRRFLADVSHELRTPLTTIRGELDILARTGRVDTEAVDAMRGEAERMSRLVGDLLLLARDESDLALSCAPVELDALLLDVFRQARRLAGDRRTVVLGHEDAAVVQGDRDRLRQLLLNLVGNALTHTPPGTEVKLGLHRSAEGARLTVSDNGPGIPAEDLPHIFERFYRVDKARSRHGGGAGLGLSITRWIAHAHGGTIEVDSAPGAGTTFTIQLPSAGPECA